MERVTWSIKDLYKADAQKCYEEVHELSEITAEAVLEKGRDENSELHKCFLWDDTEAAERYRKTQAYQIIRSFVIEKIKTEDKVNVRAIQLSSEPKVYKPTRVILQQKDEYQELLNRALRDLEIFQQRYKTLSELEGIFEEINNLLSA